MSAAIGRRRIQHKHFLERATTTLAVHPAAAAAAMTAEVVIVGSAPAMKVLEVDNPAEATSAPGAAVARLRKAVARDR